MGKDVSPPPLCRLGLSWKVVQCMQGLRPAALRIYEKKMQMENVKMGKSTQTATHTLAAIGYLLNAAEITIDCTAGWGGEKSQ